MESESRDDRKKEITMNVYPNPAINVLNIEYKSDSEQLIYIYDTQGNMNLSQKLALSTDIHRIEISTLPAGIYNIKMADQQRYYRFIKIE